MKKDYKHPRFKAVELKAERLLGGASATQEGLGSINGGTSVKSNSNTSFFGLGAESDDVESFGFDEN